MEKSLLQVHNSKGNLENNLAILGHCVARSHLYLETNKLLANEMCLESHRSIPIILKTGTDTLSRGQKTMWQLPTTVLRCGQIGCSQLHNLFKWPIPHLLNGLDVVLGLCSPIICREHQHDAWDKSGVRVDFGCSLNDWPVGLSSDWFGAGGLHIAIGPQVECPLNLRSYC